MGYEHELRLLYAVALNALVLAAGYRFARRRMGGDVVRRVIDAGLIYYLVQYVVIGVLGMMGLLSPWTIGPLALMLSALLWAGSGWRRYEKLAPFPPASPLAVAPLLDRAVLVGCFTFLAAYAAALIGQQGSLPPTADDALTYHLPAAVQWLQTGRIELFPTWFFNPANAYSPLGGSMFMAWLIAPLGNDALVRYVQLGPLLLLFFVVLEIGRLLGARDATAALVSLAAVMTRSFINPVIEPKDDLFLTVFCAAAVMSLAPARAEERWSPWRAGTAIGLLLSIKYTALFSAPILLLMADVPLRHARWRRRGLLIAGAIIVLLAGPWYLRNAILTGNPLFPVEVRVGGARVLSGLFTTTRSDALSTPGGIYDTLIGGRGYYGPPAVVIFALLIGWLAALGLSGRRALRDALWRAGLVGSMLSVALFALTAPYAEMRFVYPAVALLFAVAAGAAARIPRGGDVAAGGVLLALVLSQTLADRPDKQGFGAMALVPVGFGVALIWLTPPRHARRVRLATAGLLTAACAGYAYVNWTVYLRDYAAGRIFGWSGTRGEIAGSWDVVQRDVPAGSTVAYTNTYFVYPLQGASLRNRVVYVPAVPGLKALHDLWPSPAPLAGEQIPTFFAAQLRRGADASTWRANLAASGADYLFVGKSGRVPPPELGFIADRPAAFELLHDDATAAVYRIRDTGALAD